MTSKVGTAVVPAGPAVVAPVVGATVVGAVIGAYVAIANSIDDPGSFVRS